MLAATIAALPGNEATSADPDSSEIVRLAPPLGQAMILEITDRRLLPGGENAAFSTRLRLVFRDEEEGLTASVERIAVECSGPSVPCAAFRRAVPVGPATLRRLAVHPDASLRPLSGGFGLPDAAVPEIAREVMERLEEEDSGRVTAAELREALRFIGQPRARTLAPVIERETIGGQGHRLHRHATSSVDPVTGLVVGSRQVMRLHSADGQIISDRRWSLSME